MDRFRNIRGPSPERRKKGFKKLSPLLSVGKKIGCVVAGFAAFSLVAIFGANLGTYFSYRYHNYDYSAFPNKTTIKLVGTEDAGDLIKLALETAKLKVIGSKPPQSAELFIKLIKKGDETQLLTRHVMVWGHSHVIEKRDEEEVAIRWKYDEEKNRFIPEEGSTRYHYKNVVFGLRGDESPVIVIQNPAHTPGSPVRRSVSAVCPECVWSRHTPLPVPNRQAHLLLVSCIPAFTCQCNIDWFDASTR